MSDFTLESLQRDCATLDGDAETRQKWISKVSAFLTDFYKSLNGRKAYNVDNVSDLSKLKIGGGDGGGVENDIEAVLRIFSEQVWMSL